MSIPIQDLLEGSILYLPPRAPPNENEQLQCLITDEDCPIPTEAYDHLILVIGIEKENTGQNPDILFLTMTATPLEIDMTPYSPVGPVFGLPIESRYVLEDGLYLSKPIYIRLKHMFRLPLDRFRTVNSKKNFIEGDVGPVKAFHYRLNKTSYHRALKEANLDVPATWYYPPSPPRWPESHTRPTRPTRPGSRTTRRQFPKTKRTKYPLLHEKRYTLRPITNRLVKETTPIISAWRKPDVPPVMLTTGSHTDSPDSLREIMTNAGKDVQPISIQAREPWPRKTGTCWDQGYPKF